MSDSETTIVVAKENNPHASLGGKSLEAIERPRYKSWRKKYRKMRGQFDTVLEENRRLYKDEIKLEAIARRLREELDGLLELCLDLNQTPSLPVSLRFDVSRPHKQPAAPEVVAADITPEQADTLLLEYTAAVKEGRIPPIDLHVIREQVVRQLAAQDVRQLDDLAAGIPHAIPTESTEYPADMKGDELPGFLTSEQETEYLLRQDAKLGDRLSLTRLGGESRKDANGNQDDKNLADLAPRELERQVELLNPQSQHNWLRLHNKINTTTDVDDTESIASHDTPKTSRKRGGAGAKNLAKQVGDRALERAREGFSPGAASGVGDEDELAFVDENPGSNKKRGKDPDGTYRVKGGKSGGKGGKRKRVSGEGGDNTKKPRVDGWGFQVPRRERETS